MKIGYEAKRIFHNRTGLGNYGRDLVRVLSAFYPEHTYLLYNPKPSRHRLFHPDGIHVIERLPHSRIDRFFYNVWRQRNVVKDLAGDGVQLFHGLSGELPVGLSKLRIRSVVTIHDLIFVRYPELYSTIDRTIYLRKFKYAANHADRIIAISEQTKRDLIDFLKVDERRINVMYQGCHPVFKQPLTEAGKQAVRHKYGVPRDFVFHVGTVEARKNTLTLIQAVEPLDIHLVVAGRPTSYIKKVKEYIAKKNLTSKVTFIHGASVTELAALYQSALLFVYPSLFEGFGIPIIEALYSGVPVITSSGGCFQEAGGPSSVYVTPQDSSALSAAISTVLSDSQLRQRMVKAGLSYSLQFDDDRIADQLMALYNEII